MAKPWGRSSRSTRRSTPPGFPSAGAGAWAKTGAATARTAARRTPRPSFPRISDLRPRVEAQAHLGLEDLQRLRIHRLDLLGDGRGQADVVAVVDAARDHGEEHAVLGVDVPEAAVHPGRAGEGVPLAEDDLLAAVVIEGELELAFEHDEGLEGFHVGVQARPLPGGHDGDEHGEARGIVDGRVVPKADWVRSSTTGM